MNDTKLTLKDGLGAIALVLILVVFSILIAYWFGYLQDSCQTSVGVPQLPATIPTSSSDSFLPIATSSESIFSPEGILITPTFTQHDEGRLDELDGGKVKEWDCTEESSLLWQAQYPDESLLFPQNFVDITPVVVETVGAETVGQLGYSGCTLIPQSQWPIMNPPINP
jgi:hypothetical protein